MSCNKGFTKVTAQQLAGTLAQQLIPIADNIRDLASKFGIRPYVVRLVRVKWSGDERWRGEPFVVDSMDILPTPKVTDLQGLIEIVSAVGVDEQGQVLVSEISGRYTDDDLRLVQRDGDELEPDEELIVEIEYPEPRGGTSLRRRFNVRSAPEYVASDLMWRMRLEKAGEDRGRNGEVL